MSGWLDSLLGTEVQTVLGVGHATDQGPGQVHPPAHHFGGEHAERKYIIPAGSLLITIYKIILSVMKRKR